jgi:hypothetical protein
VGFVQWDRAFMKPKFATVKAWEQSELLMQPVYIRLIDNLRKTLEDSTWTGDYREFYIWGPEVSEETQARYLLLQQEMKEADEDLEAEIEAAIAVMPVPFLGYELLLHRSAAAGKLDLWHLCYEICFINPDLAAQNPEVEVDESLIDAAGEVDWARLEAKTKAIVSAAFGALES